MIQKEINVLGTKYIINFEFENKRESLEDRYGYVDFSSNNIYINLTKIEEAEDKASNINETVRHKIVYAFWYESGLNTLDSWSRNEEVVYWIAIQFTKIADVLSQVKFEEYTP